MASTIKVDQIQSDTGNLSIASANLQFSSSGARITGDFSNATVASRVSFQTSTVNGATSVLAIPNGTAVNSSFGSFNNSDPTNAAYGAVGVVGSTDVRLTSGITGTGTYLPMTFYTGGSERMRIGTSGNVGLGITDNVNIRLQIQQAVDSDVGGIGFTSVDGTKTAVISELNTGAMTFRNGGSERMRIDTSGNLLFNSGYGSVATAYGCRAWVNFNGTGTVAIRASGNVSSITDNGFGNYTVNFTNAMPDANYSVSWNVGTSTRTSIDDTGSRIYLDSGVATASSVRVFNTLPAGTADTTTNGNGQDMDLNYVSIFR